MFNFNHTLRFFGLCFGLFLVLVFSACEKENNKPNSSLSDGSFVELTYKGKKYRMDAFGITGSQDTTFTIQQTGDVFNFQVFTFGLTDLHNIQGVEDWRVFSVSIINYDGEGTYQYDSSNFDWNAFSGLLGAIYYNFPDNEFFDFESGQVKVDKDNTNEVSGTFNLNVTTGPDGTNSPAIPCTGKFKIVKR